MRKITTKIAFLIFLLQVSTLFAGAFIMYIHARSEGENVTVTWQTGKETALSKFVVERKTVNGEFSEISDITPRGDNSTYNFVDESAFKANDAIYVYRIKIIDNNSSVTYSSEVSISHNVSSVKRTWGSIKALFR